MEVNFIASLRLPRRTPPQRKGRDCRSCHANPAALGYGRGQLKYEVKGGAGNWIFTPAYPRSPQDGLPMDAWIGFLQEPGADTTTRKDARPFTLQEQRNILLVGACLECHNEKEPSHRRCFCRLQELPGRAEPAMPTA